MHTKITLTGLFVLAFVSAVLNYAGFTRIIPPDDWWLRALCLLTAIAVWIGLYLFWRYAFSIQPELRMASKRLQGWSAISIGCAFIVALSTYWNVIAFTGHEVLRQANQSNVTHAEARFADAQGATGGHARLIPQLQALSASAMSLANGEEFNGAITGSRGRGGVTEVLRQIGSKVADLAASLEAVSKNTDRLKADGKACLARMRQAQSDGGANYASELAAGADCLNGVMAELGNVQASSGIAQVLEGLSASVVIPVSIRTDSQRAALSNVLKGLQGQADSIARAARAIPEVTPTPLRLNRPNMATAVLTHWQGIIPAIATALAIDLLPLLLLVLGVVFHRDTEQDQRPRHLWTMIELADAHRQIEAIRSAPELKLIEERKPKGDDEDASDEGEPK